VFILGRLDKVGNDWRGDPSSALLEVLDPAHNNSFPRSLPRRAVRSVERAVHRDGHILEPVSRAARSLEVIDLPGYTEDDKAADRTSLSRPASLVENGLTTAQVKISDAALRQIIRHYTREAGVRNLEREISNVRAQRPPERSSWRDAFGHVTNRTVAELLGSPRFQQEVATHEDEVGVATGLAYTPTGGEVLFMRGAGCARQGHLVLTGQLGDVMKESAQAALTYAPGARTGARTRD